MYLLYDSGCRIQEILSLKLKDFFVQNGTAELHIIGKGNKFRITPISEELIPKFERYCRHYHKSSTYDDYLFYTKRRGVCSQMSCDTAQTFIKKYGIMAQNSTRPFPMYTPIYLGTPALCTCIWQVCRWSLFPNGSAILSWRHL